MRTASMIAGLVMGSAALCVGGVPARAQGSFFKSAPEKAAPKPKQPKEAPKKPKTATPAPAAKQAAPMQPKAQVIEKTETSHAHHPKPPREASAASGPFNGFERGNIVLVGGRKFRLPEIKAVSPSADLSVLRAWIARNGGTLKCGHFGSHVTCLTETKHDLGFALVFNGLAQPSSRAPREFQLAYAAVQRREEALAQDRNGLIRRLLAGQIKPGCQFIFTCGHEMASEGYLQEAQLYRNQDWVGLVRKIADIDYKIDVNYFYLGRAAQEMGAVNAARAYYIEAAELYVSANSNDRCGDHNVDYCGGLDLRSDIQGYLNEVKALELYRF